MIEGTPDINIFYTDDDSEDQEIFGELVQEVSARHRVFLQSHGDELLKMLAAPLSKPSLVFLDLNMPRKNGFEVLKEIRESKVNADIPVIIISTSSDEKLVARTREMGANMYISKPSSYTQFREILRGVLTGPQDFVSFTKINVN